MDCIFCKIANHEVPSTIVAENEYAIAFEDLSPVAPVHVLVIPKMHISNVLDLNDENIKYVSEIHKMIKEVAKIKNIDESGFRVITNCGEDGGQTVYHLHYHVIGGKALGPKIIQD